MSSSVNVHIDGLADLITDINKAGGSAKTLVTAALYNAATKTQSNIRNRAPMKTGSLKRSILTQVNYPSAEVYSQEKYADWVERGTGIYGPNEKAITPKNGKVFATRTSPGFGTANKKGYFIIGKSIKGMKARPFFGPGVDESKDYIESQFLKVIEKLITIMAGK